MPMPKLEKPEDLRVNGRVPKTLDIKAQKAYKDHPDIANRMVELAEAKKAADEASQEK